MLTWWKTKYDGLLGKAINPRAGVQYGWCFEFQVFPPNIAAEPGIVFDVTRQKNAIFWDVISGATANVETKPWPNIDDVNDDHYNDPNSDNDNTPNMDRIYSIDGPGIVGAPAQNQTKALSYVNFREFVRASVNGGKLLNQGNINDKDINTQGSRCSAKFLWHMSMDVTPSGDVNLWKETAPGSFNSDVGHITLPKP